MAKEALDVGSTDAPVATDAEGITLHVAVLKRMDDSDPPVEVLRYESSIDVYIRDQNGNRMDTKHLEDATRFVTDAQKAAIKGVLDALLAEADQRIGGGA